MPIPRTCVCSLSYTIWNAHASYCRLWPLWLYNVFPHYSYLLKGTIFKKKNLYKIQCVFLFPYNFCLKHFSFQEELGEIWSKIFVGIHVNYLFFLSELNESWIFSRDSKSSQISNFTKIHSVGAGAKLFHAVGRTDRQTDKTKLIVALCNFSERPQTINVFMKYSKSLTAIPFIFCALWWTSMVETCNIL